MKLKLVNLMLETTSMTCGRDSVVQERSWAGCCCSSLHDLLLLQEGCCGPEELGGLIVVVLVQGP